MRAQVGFLLLVIAVGCGGGGGIDSDCRETTDCSGDLYCAGPNDPPVCGIAPRQECAADVDCPGARCHAIDDSCSRDGIGSQCGPGCVGDGECGGGFRCDAGACVAILCDAGYTCAARERCAPSEILPTDPIYDRHHGCFPTECLEDAGCGARFCVNGTCQDGPGACAEQMLVP